MQQKFEQQKILRYFINALSNKKFVRQYLDKICIWLLEEQNFLPFKYGNIKKGNRKNCYDFVDFAREHPQTTIRKIEEWVEKVKKIPLAQKKYAPDRFEKNLRLAQSLFGLDEIEKNVLEFFILKKCNPLLRDCVSGFKAIESGENNFYIYLNISEDLFFSAVRLNGPLFNFGLISKHREEINEVSTMSESLYYTKFNTLKELRTFLLGKPTSATLSWKDFSFMNGINTLSDIFKQSLKQKSKGINILFYGEQGTGKTEFAKTLARHCRFSLYALERSSERCFTENNNRYELAQRYNILLKNNNKSALLIDEAEDLLGKYSRAEKIEVNRILENNTTPIIWITNNISNIDKAYLRRFTFALNFKIPDKNILENIWLKNLKQSGLPATKEIAHDFVKRYSLPPSFVTSATKSIHLINGDFETVKVVLNSLEKAYHNGVDYPVKTSEKPDILFNTNLLCTDIDLKLLSEQIKKQNYQHFSLCLYGASGTGKSAFAEYLGEYIGLSTIKKRCSDLIGKYVGETEENIARAFNEAEEKGAMLIFDEADSFLQDRTKAFRSWEITQVNEMLTQMEKSKYPFVCTTNLIGNIDSASLRRFTFKVKYNYLTAEKASLCFEHFFHIKDVDLSHFSSLTPGDFSVVKQKAEILDCLNDKNALIQMLEQEQLCKAPICHKIGFL